MTTEALHHAIAQPKEGGKPNTLCKGIPIPDPAITQAKNWYDVTCPECARALVEMGCGSRWDHDPKLAAYLKQIASGDHPPNWSVGPLGR
jgi:hypothetical protein